MTATTQHQLTHLQVRRCTPHSLQSRSVHEAISDAMVSDPAWTQIAPDQQVRRVLMSELVALSMRVAFKNGGQVWSALDDDGRTRAGIIWDPPGVYPLTGRDYLSGLVHSLSLASRHPRVTLRVVRMGAGIERFFPAHPVAYVSFVGAAPHLQRCAAGKFLLDAVAQECDRQGWDCFLETQNPANVSYYAALGYQLIAHAEHTYPGGPPNWSMLRPHQFSAVD